MSPAFRTPRRNGVELLYAVYAGKPLAVPRQTRGHRAQGHCTHPLLFPSHCYAEALLCLVQYHCPVLQCCSGSHPLSSQLCRIAPLRHPSKNFVAAVLLFHTYFLKNNLLYKNQSDYVKSSGISKAALSTYVQ